MCKEKKAKQMHVKIAPQVSNTHCFNCFNCYCFSFHCFNFHVLVLTTHFSFFFIMLLSSNHTGTYQPFQKSNSCPLSCPPGYFSLGSEGSSSLAQACGKCPLGSYCSVGIKFDCPKGTYNDQEKKASVGQCKSCLKGQYNAVTAATNPSFCITCKPDARGEQTTTKSIKSEAPEDCQVIAFSCPKGERPISNTECEDCPQGTYGDDRGKSCVLCPTGYYQSATKQSKCEPCTTTNTCGTTLGATSQTGVVLPLEYSLVFENVGNNGTRGGTKVLDNSESLDLKFEITDDVTTPLYITLAVIVLINLALHRFCPSSFKNADVLFAGDHFIDDSVSDCILLLFFFFYS
jgi:hypothetical protein